MDSILANYYCLLNFGGGYQIDMTADFVNKLIKARDNIVSKFKRVECVVLTYNPGISYGFRINSDHYDEMEPAFKEMVEVAGVPNSLDRSSNLDLVARVLKEHGRTIGTGFFEKKVI